MTLKDILSDVSDVVKEILNASAISPATKMDLHTKLNNAVSSAATLTSSAAGAVEDEAEALPAEAGGAAEVVVEKAGALAGPVGGAVASMAAPVAGAEVAQLAGQFLSVFEKHNQSLMDELGSIAKSAGATTKTS